MVDFTQTLGVGVADLQHAALAEARRLMHETKGDRGAATGLVFDRLRELGWISETERDVPAKMHAVGAQSSDGQNADHQDGRPAAAAANLEVRRVYLQLLTKSDTSPVALALAAGAAGSYEAVQGNDGTTVVYAKSNRKLPGDPGGGGGRHHRRRDRRRTRSGNRRRDRWCARHHR